jgi:hypothetical protein
MRVTLGEEAVSHIQKKGGRAAVDLISMSS